MDKRPNCQDGCVCKGLNEGFMVLKDDTGKNVFVCGDCYLKIEADMKKKKFDEAVKRILKQEGLI